MNIGEVRTAISVALSDLGIRPYSFAPDSPACPCVYIHPDNDDEGEPTTFDGTADPIFVATFLVAAVVSESGQDQLDALISTSGAGSAFAALRADPTLGGTVESSHARRWRNYGPVAAADGNRYWSVEIEIKVNDS